MLDGVSRIFMIATFSIVILVGIPSTNLGIEQSAYADGPSVVYDGPLYEVGTCVESFCEDVPSWAEDLIDVWESVTKFWDIAHHDAYAKQYSDFTKEQEQSSNIRGFFATFNDKSMWTVSMYMYFEHRSIIHVDSEMKTFSSRPDCTAAIEYSEAHIIAAGLIGSALCGGHLRI